MKAAFKQLKINAVYKPIDCKKGDLAGIIKKIRSGEIAGANVTRPHKEVVIKYLDKLTPAAKKIGAVNTIYRRGNKVVGDNTDGRGFLTALCRRVDVPTCRRAIIMGAGGAAKAICHALCDTSINSLAIVNRSISNAKKLIKLLTPLRQHVSTSAHQHVDTSTLQNVDTSARLHVGTSSRRHIGTLLINSTPLGSPGHPWPSLDFVKRLPKNTVVFDIVTHPAETPLIKAAKRRGLKVIYGREMLLHQGALAFEAWTGRKAPINVMRAAID